MAELMDVGFKELLSVQHENIYIERKRAAGGQKAQEEPRRQRDHSYPFCRPW